MNASGWASALTLGAALLAASSARAEPKRFGRCHDLRVGAPDSPAERGGRRRHTPVLSAAQAKDLEFLVSIPEDAVGRPVQVKLFTPNGAFFQVLDAVADEATSSERDGRRRSRRRTQMVSRFPVAGTQVTSHALFGEWRAEVYLDGAETPCSRPLRFVLER